MLNAWALVFQSDGRLEKTLEELVSVNWEDISHTIGERLGREIRLATATGRIPPDISPDQLHS